MKTISPQESTCNPITSFFQQPADSMLDFIRSRFARFGSWWRTPVTPKDRALGVLVGAIGGFCVLAFALMTFGMFSHLSAMSGWWVVPLLLPGSLAGFLFPKHVTVVLFPFLSVGGGA